MSNSQEDTPRNQSQNESTTAGNTVAEPVSDKTRNTVPTVYPDVEFVNRTLP